MEEIKPKKERRFLKAMGDVALTLVRELLLNVGKKLINKSGNKRQSLVLAFIILASTFAVAQYPTTGNKQRLGYQTTGDGLVYRGRSNDTTTIKSSGLNNAYHIYDTINNVLYSYVKTKGGWVFNSTGTVIINNNFTQPVDSLFFNVGVSTNNVDTAKMRWDSDLATVVLGLNDNVPNELGFKNFWLVKNQTGATITKGSIVYANGTVGASGRITVAKFIANGSIESKYLLGITAHDLSNGEDGYVISFGKIRQVNTDTFAAGAILYPSPTVAGVWTDIEPVAPNIDMPIGFCINSHANNGTIAIRVASGYKLSELHDVAISSPIDRASLYYRGGLWRDTTAALLVSDTASMLTNYLKGNVNLTSQVTGILPLLNGGTGANTQSGARTNLGGTGIGQYLFTLSNSGTNKYARFDATNQVTLLTSSELRTDIGAGTGNGTVTSVGLSLPNTNSIFALSGSPITTSGTLALTYSGTPLPIANGGTGATTAATARTALGATVRGSNTFTIPDGSSVAFLRYNADNTVSQRAADGMRTDLGGTTIGQSMFTLTNPSAITFPRFNADNTVSALDAATFRTAIGAGTGTGNGTVTSVTGTAPISVANGTTTPSITIANAGISTTGVVTASTQTFGGAKTFNGALNASSELAVTGISNLNGGATIGTMATTSTLTHVLGVNSSNAIGEIALSNGIAISGGFLGLDIKTSITVGTDFPNTNAQSSSDITFTLPGVSVGQPVLLGVPDGSANANTNYTAWVSAANTVKIRFNNYSSAAVNPASGSFTISVINL